MRYIVFIGCFFGISACNTTQDWKDPDAHIEDNGVYCYSTLGSVDCYKRPVKRCVRQPLGYEGPPPPQDINE
jgi:hypothetical protein